MLSIRLASAQPLNYKAPVARPPNIGESGTEYAESEKDGLLAGSLHPNPRKSALLAVVLTGAVARGTKVDCQWCLEPAGHSGPGVAGRASSSHLNGTSCRKIPVESVRCLRAARIRSRVSLGAPNQPTYHLG